VVVVVVVVVGGSVVVVVVVVVDVDGGISSAWRSLGTASGRPATSAPANRPSAATTRSSRSLFTVLKR